MSEPLDLVKLREEAETAYTGPCAHRAAQACSGCYHDRIVDFDEHIVTLIDMLAARTKEFDDLKSSWVWKAWDVGALPEEVLVKERALSEAQAEVVLLRGAMAAQDEREQAAGLLCGVPREEHGCDWPDAVADQLNHWKSEAERWRDKFQAHLDRISKLI